jgi:hypothetical protein
VTDWPEGADGDVFRRLLADGFDFSKPLEIDFNVDFEGWPPQPDAVEHIRAHFTGISLIPPEDGSDGYILVQVFDRVTYSLVLQVQDELSKLAAPFGGVCESWGVLNDSTVQK